MNKPAGTAWRLRTAYLKSHRGKSLIGRVTLGAATIMLAAVLGGCGGGGGGGSSGPAPNTSYPTVSNSVTNSANGGVTTNYSKTANILKPESGLVSVSLNAPAKSVSIAVSIPPIDPAFNFTVGLAALVPLGNSPLNSCPTCLRAGPTTAVPDGQPVSFIYLDPSIAGLAYSTLGLWSKPTTSPAGSEVGAAFSIGVVTRPQDLPIFGSQTYNGFMVGRFSNGSKTYAVSADVTAVVTFSVTGSLVNFTTTNTRIAEESGSGALDLVLPALAPALDLTSSAPMTYSGSSTNSVKGDLTRLIGGNMTGPVTAKYYGPPTGPGATPAEFGGAFFVGSGTEQMNGSFALKK